MLGATVVVAATVVVRVDPPLFGLLVRKLFRELADSIEEGTLETGSRRRFASDCRFWRRFSRIASAAVGLRFASPVGEVGKEVVVVLSKRSTS